MNRNHLLLVAVVVAGVLLLPSAAAPFTGSGDQVHEDLVMQPHAGPNGDYAVMESSGGTGTELALRFGPSNPNVDGDGVNADSVTPVDRVFNITYTGDRSAEVWLESNVDGVSFYRDGDPTDSLAGSDNSVTLGPNGTLVVGVLVDTRNRQTLRGDSFTVHAEIADGETTTGGTPTETTVTVGTRTETTTAGTPTERTTGGTPTEETPTGTTTDGTPTETTTEGAPTEPTTQESGSGSDGGDSGGEVTGQVVTDEMTQAPGTTTAEGEVSTVTTTEVTGTVTDRELEFRVIEATVQQTTVQPGETVTIDGTVENIGERDGTATVRLYANGGQVATAQVFVPAGETRQVSYVHAFDSPGEYELRVEGTLAGTVDVVQETAIGQTPAPATTAAPAEEPTPEPSTSDFPWLLLALLAVLVLLVGYLFARNVKETEFE
jgi:hypothetical protein